MVTQKPVATPCRNEQLPGDLEGVPDINDQSVPKPKAGELRISQDAIAARLRRVFTPNVKGEYKISTEIVNQWKSKKGRQPLMKLFQTVGYSPDTWVTLVYVSTNTPLKKPLDDLRGLVLMLHVSKSLAH